MHYGKEASRRRQWAVGSILLGKVLAFMWMWIVADQVHPIMALVYPNGSATQLGPKGAAANVLVPDITTHLQRSGGMHALVGQSYFDLHNIS